MTSVTDTDSLSRTSLNNKLYCSPPPQLDLHPAAHSPAPPTNPAARSAASGATHHIQPLPQNPARHVAGQKLRNSKSTNWLSPQKPRPLPNR